MKVITLCGSAKFKKYFREMEAAMTLEGNIVMSPIFFEQSEGITITQEKVQLLKELHFRRIDMSDEIFVIDVNGYIGNSTKKEISYAKDNGKRIHYYSRGI